MGRNRFGKASRGNRCRLYDLQGETVLRHDLEYCIGLSMVATKRAVAMVNDHGVVTGFKMRPHSAAALPVPRTRRPVLSFHPTTGVLTNAESQAASGLYGRSKTSGMTEEKRAEREAWGMDAEDFIERAIEKRKVYAHG